MPEKVEGSALSAYGPHAPNPSGPYLEVIMNYQELIQLYFDRSNALQGYWTLYVVVIGGLLAISSLRQRRDRLTLVLISVLYAGFAYKNLDAIHDVTMQRAAALQAVHQITTLDPASPGPKLRELLEPTLVQPAWEGTRDFHLICDVLTIAAIWAMELRRVRQAKALDAAHAA
jgi:hypothetical protein